ncbi:zinc-containing alcohol dehydrogenase superfamily protein [Caballeronia calidae]|uniref:Zinc-containing alcohol dehydrogenase superfamily protein n=2 Tax=Caballeronia calidae TaxID=1777139 RepID=A0A158EJ66_9BURK|nr:zinc-containing alcohol dehydrogenase superfamily protein [Caballeronia calidae]
MHQSVKGSVYEYHRDRGPCIVGHEPCGIVVEVGEGVTEQQARIGQRVMVHHYSGCNCCDQCRTGWPQICEEMRPFPRMFGSNAHGSHAEYMKVPSHTVIPLPDELSFEAGAAISCGSGTAYSALRRLGVNALHTIAIFGQGHVGLAGTQFAVAMGARVIALDISDARLELARKFGADVVLNPTDVQVRSAIRELTNGRGADYALETSGAATARQDALGAVRLWGSVAYVGLGPAPTLNVNSDLIMRQVSAIGSLTFSTVIQREAALFAAAHHLDIDAIFSHRWALSQAREAYIVAGAQTAGKGVFVF